MTEQNNNSEYDKLLNHEYDGIREYDNPLPGWWKTLFWLSGVFSILYIAWYHIRPDNSIYDQYNNRVATFYEAQLENLGISEPSNASILQIMNNAEVMGAMSRMFAGNCGQCHRADGGGNVGPNLADEKFKNIKEPIDLYTVIAEGIPGTSMPAWETRMREPQIMMLAAYVAHLRGSTPASPKAEEGVVIPAWETFAPAADNGEDDDATIDNSSANNAVTEDPLHGG